MENKNRDFVDFVIELVIKRRIFYFFLAACLAYGTYFNIYKNKEYKLETTIKISSESVLMPIINNINVYNTSADVYLTPLKGNVSYAGLALDLCGIIRSTFIDIKFHNNITTDYINKNPETLNRDEVLATFKNALSIEKSTDPGVCVIVVANANLEIVNYLHKYYGSVVNSYLKDEISKRLEFTRTGKIDFLTKSLASTQTGSVTETREEILSTLELNALEERRLVVLSKLALVETTPIAETDISYFMYRVSNVQKTLGTIFIYSFAIFMSFILHVLAIVLIDFRKQYRLRQNLKQL